MRLYISGRNANSTITPLSDTSFRSHLDSLGKLSDSFDMETDVYVALDVDKATLRELDRLAVKPEQAVLLRFEPAVVCPMNYSSTHLRRFGRIIDIGRLPETAATWERWPQYWPSHETLEQTPDAKDRICDRLVLINANKLSLISGEMYSFRRILIHNFRIDTFGYAWSSGLVERMVTALVESKIAITSLKIPNLSSLRLWWARHPGLKGSVSDKIETLAKYKLAVVVENSPEYMSEKLFDALFSGCIPIYVGPEPEKYGIPSGLVICSEPDLNSFGKAIERANGLDTAKWRRELHTFLKSKATRDQWEVTSVFEKLITAIEAQR